MRVSILFVLLVLNLNVVQAASKIASYNIRNFDYDERSHTPTNKFHLVRTLGALDADLIAVQEINNVSEFQNMIETNFNGEYSSVLTECGGAHGQRLGFVYKKSAYKLLSFEQDLRTSNVNNPSQQSCNAGSRPLALAVFRDLETNKMILTISVHLKSGGREKDISKRFKQIKVIENVIQEYKNDGVENFIVMGDFNSTQYSLRDQHYENFKHKVSKLNAIDATENIKCTAYWWGGIDDLTQYPSHLDHILISDSLTNGQKVQATKAGHCQQLACSPTLESKMGVSFDEVSDHCPLSAELN